MSPGNPAYHEARVGALAKQRMPQSSRYSMTLRAAGLSRSWSPGTRFFGQTRSALRSAISMVNSRSPRETGRLNSSSMR